MMGEFDNKIVHVAAAGEDRGRVVLHLASGNPHRIALQAALRVARAFQASIESLFVEDEQLIDLAGHATAREISRFDGAVRLLSADTVMREMRGEARLAEQRVGALARIAEVPYHARVVRSERLRALATACAECGPWNVIALADPVRFEGRDIVGEILLEVPSATGLVLVGPLADRSHGPVVLAVEDVERLPQMLRAAEQLVRGGDDAVTVVLIAAGHEALAEMEGQARLLIGEMPEFDIAVADLAEGAHAAAAELLRRIGAGFVIARHGGRVVPADGDRAASLAVLQCPMFVVR